MVTGSRPGAGELEGKLSMDSLADTMTRVRAEVHSVCCPRLPHVGVARASVPWQNSGQRPEKGIFPMDRKTIQMPEKGCQ